MIYRSKKDVWLVALVAAALLLPVAGAIYAFANGDLQAVGSLLWVGLIIALIGLFA